MPIERKPGQLALITYDAQATFTAFSLTKLPADLALREPSAPAAPAAAKAITLDEAKAALTLAERSLAVASAQPDVLRARAAAEHLGLSIQEATAWVEKTEAERVRFIKRTFDHDPREAGHYDLVVNTSRLSVEETSDIIIEALRRLERHARPEEKRAAAPVLN